MTAEPSTAQSPEQLADRVAAAVSRVPGVVGLHGGAFGEAATYLPGRRVAGVRLTDAVAEVHITVVYGTPVDETAEKVRAAVTPLVTTPVDVRVEDIVPVAPEDE